MKSLFELCEPLDSLFDENKKDDVLDLNNFLEGKIDPKEFFQENFITSGMENLVLKAFERFGKRNSTCIGMAKK
jgi:predicted AAA+ superfamily ATPase